jgi:hypothetical protein
MQAILNQHRSGGERERESARTRTCVCHKVAREEARSSLKTAVFCPRRPSADARKDAREFSEAGVRG